MPRSTGWPSPNSVPIGQPKALVACRIAAGTSKTEALRVLNRHLADVLYAAMCADEQAAGNSVTAGQPAAA